MIEKREAQRRPYSKVIGYTVAVLDYRDLRRLSNEGEIVDISDTGLGMQTEYPLEPGHVLMFDNNDMGIKSGIVRWSVKENSNGYKVGVRFV